MTLIFSAGSDFGSSNNMLFWVIAGSLMSLGWKICTGLLVPAMDVSGIPVFRGGGGGGSSLYWVYAVLVCIFRFEEDLYELQEENARRRCWHGRVDEEANLDIKAAGEARGAATLWIDMVKDGVGSIGARRRSYRQLQRRATVHFGYDVGEQQSPVINQIWCDSGSKCSPIIPRQATNQNSDIT